MRILITGGAGFIGSHLVDKLIEQGNEVIVLDNLSTGRKENIEQHLNSSKFQFYQVNILTDKIDNYFKNIDEVWHLAANPDVRAALINPKVDVDQNILVTFNILEAMRKNNVKRILFISSSTVYGEARQIPTPENYSPLIPISLYGASKLACEALISAYHHTFVMSAIIFRLANIIGPRLTHGVICDFINKLKQNPNKLEILGNGNQKKSYLYVDDCIDAMLLANEKVRSDFEIFNVGNNDWITVKQIAKIVCKKLNLQPILNFTGGKQGWKGDIPLMLLDIGKIKKFTDWKPKINSYNAIQRTLNSF
jgi:UDP-glucose 4-epimerase